MCNWIILFLLFCGGNGSFLNGGCGCNRGRNNDNGCGCDRDGGNGRGRDRDNDCGCGRDRDGDNGRGRDREMTPPPWIRSNYNNGDTCGCEEK